MDVSEDAQNLLKTIWIDVNEKSRSILDDYKTRDFVYNELIENNLINEKNGKIELTVEGESRGVAIIRKHRLAERLLSDLMLADETLSDEQACVWEHSLRDGIEENICTLLGHPRFCPHGMKIPKGECCVEGRKQASRVIVSLSEVQAGQSGQIAYLQLSNTNVLDKLLSMGLLPGSAIALIRRTPSFVFKADSSQFAVDKEIASHIYVRIENNNHK